MSVHRKTATQRQKRKKQRKAAASEAAGIQPSAAATATAAAKPRPAPKPAPQPKAVGPPEGRLAARWYNLRQMIQNTWSEIKKITWPDGETTRKLTVLVIVMATFLGVLLGGIDYILLQVFEAI